jgi:hypothetical protein
MCHQGNPLQFTSKPTVSGFFVGDRSQEYCKGRRSSGVFAKIKITYIKAGPGSMTGKAILQHAQHHAEGRLKHVTQASPVRRSELYGETAWIVKLKSQSH